MSFVATKNKFHVALDGQGLILQGAPDRPAYIARNAPVYGTRFASGDRDYNDLSQWWYFIQTDWSGGFKDSQSWADDAKFYYSANIDAFSKTGSIQLMRKPAQVKDFTEAVSCGLETSLSAGVLVSSWRSPSATTNPNNFDGTSFGSIGYGNWTNPTNVYSDNASNATAAQGGGKYQHYSGFGFSIPAGATIVGVESRMEAACTQETGENGTQIFMSLMEDGTSVDAADIWNTASRSHPAQPAILTGSQVLYTRGGSSDLWGGDPGELTSTIVNNSNFGCQIHGNRSSNPTSTNYEVDYLQLRIYYRLAATDRALYIGTDSSNGLSQPVVYASDDDGATFDDISTAEFTNNGRKSFMHLSAPFGVLWALTMTYGTNEANLVNTWDGDTWTDQSASVAGVVALTPTNSRCAVAVADEQYVFVDNPDEGYALVKTSVVVPTSSSDFELVFERAASQAAPFAACEYNGDIYYLVGTDVFSNAVARGAELRKYDIAADVDTLVKVFKGGISIRVDYGSNNCLVNTGVSLVITIPGNEIWEIQGTALTRIYKQDEDKAYLGGDAFGNPGQNRPFLRGGGVVSSNKVWWGNLIYDPVQRVFFHGHLNFSDDTVYPENLVVPIVVDRQDTIYYISENDISYLESYNPGSGNSGSFKSGASNTAFLVFSNHDKLQSIDKLLHMVTIGFEPFDTAEEIKVYYSFLPSPSTAISDWTLLGSASASVDGASVVFKNMLFPSGTVGKKVWFRVELSGDTTSTPQLNDFTLEYLPVPDYKKEWQIIGNIADEVKRLDGALTEDTARELKSRLERAWWTKSQLDFQDLDYASTALVDNPLTNSATTVTVTSTQDFPEQGRIKIDDEEIFYLGKTPTQFTGCVRGVRGTKAVQHSAAAVVHNGFKAIVLGVEVRVPVIAEGKHLEYTFALNLREV